MNIRKLFTFNRRVQKVNKNSVRESPQQLSDAPSVIKSMIISFLPDKEKIRTAEVNQSFSQFFKSQAAKKPGFYYAVGSNIDLTSPCYIVRNWQHELVESLCNGAILFNDYPTAQKYADLRQIRYYDREMDLFFPLSTPGVFIVQLNQDGPYSKISITIRVKEHIPECPMPPAPERMETTGFKVSPDNIKILFSSFCGNLRNHATNHDRFMAIWKEGVSEHQEAQQSVLSGVLAVFNSYYTCYSRFTRHNQALVQQIIDKALQNPSIEDLHDFIISAYQAGMENNAIDKNGHYMEMLNFVNIQLNLLRKMNQLPRINTI